MEKIETFYKEYEDMFEGYLDDVKRILRKKNEKYIKLQEKYKNSNMCVGIVMIDNYEEIMQGILSEDKPEVIAKIEKRFYTKNANLNKIKRRSHDRNKKFNKQNIF